MTRDEKKKIMAKYGIHPKDTGSAQVQVAILTFRINELSKHLEKHSKDEHSRRGLLGLVGDRRKNLQYMHMHDEEKYKWILDELKLRK